MLGNSGRLGNQMFQYASLVGIASRHGYEYCLPPDNVINSSGYDTNLFKCFKIPHAKQCITNFKKLSESTTRLDKEIWEHCPDNVNLFGYFQTELYFKHIEDKIRSSFIFIDDIYENAKEILKYKIGNSEVISVHVRRGDYLLSDGHIKLSPQYYEVGLELLPKDIPVMIFSDGLDWCKSQKVFDGNRFFFMEGNCTEVDLCLQSLCNYHIIANSSFSWWGAWLAKSNKVIAPKTWFGVEGKDTYDLYLKDWIIL